MTTLHPDDDELVLHASGDAHDPQALDAHLAACDPCGARAREIRELIAAAQLEAPDPGPDFEARTWARLRPALTARSRPRAWRATGAWIGLAASVLLAFLLGREFPRSATTPAPEPAASAMGQATRDRILVAAVQAHLERSQRVLVAAAHPQGDEGLEPARALAADLVRDNRLYRQTAVRSGEAGLADVLDELERLLVDLSKAPEDAPAEDAAALRERVDDVLFKVRVLGSRLRDQGGTRARRVRPATS
jgi:hypothetical protein